MNKYNILIVEDDDFSRENILISLRDDSYNLDSSVSPKIALDKVKKTKFDIIISDIKMPYMDGVTFIEKVKETNPNVKTILITGYADDAAVIKALKIGINDFLKKPYRDKELKIAVDKLAKLIILEKENENLKQQLLLENRLLKEESYLATEDNKYHIAGSSQNIIDSKHLIKKASEYKLNVMIQGESGTGKELIARNIHALNNKVPFVAVNCAAIPEKLLESEFFGHVKGSFTGATADKTGLLEMADGGILFLDEITEMPIDLQSKLLRVIETGTFFKIGSNKIQNCSIQYIAASNRLVSEAIENNFLRIDLYYRLALIEINLAPLRKRKEDIPEICQILIDKCNKKYKKGLKKIDPELMSKIQSYDWKGNIRELSNFITKWYLFDYENIENNEITRTPIEKTVFDSTNKFNFNFDKGDVKELEEFRKHLAYFHLKNNNYNKSKAAVEFGLSYPAYLKLLK